MKRISVILICIVLILSNLILCFAADAKPLFEFDYDGSHIQTFGTYSIIDGRICYSHRYFIKNGNLVVIDQNLDPTPTGIFIHFESGKSYIAVLCKSGKIVSLGTEDLCSSLKDFKNKDIKSLAETVSYDSRYLNFEYTDGSKRTYDCVTGELYSQTGATTRKTAEEFFNDYFDGVISNSISMGADTSGVKAQGVVNALNGSGASLEQLLDAGIVEGIESDYAGESSDQQFSGEWSYEVGVPEASSEIKPYDFTQNEDYQRLMESKEAELSKEEVDELRNLFAKISRGEISNKEAINLIHGETKQEKQESVFQIDKDTKEEIASTIEAVEQSAKEYKEEHKNDKKFIEAKASEKYIAVYNAEEKHYEIYSEKNLLSDPEHLETETKKVKNIEKVDGLNNLLSSEKSSDMQRGMSLFVIIAIAIVAIAVVVLIIGVLNSKKPKKLKYE